MNEERDFRPFHSPTYYNVFPIQPPYPPYPLHQVLIAYPLETGLGGGGDDDVCRSVCPFELASTFIIHLFIRKTHAHIFYYYPQT